MNCLNSEKCQIATRFMKKNKLLTIICNLVNTEKTNKMEKQTPMKTAFTSEEVKAAIKKLQKNCRLQQTPRKILEETMLKQNR